MDASIYLLPFATYKNKTKFVFIEIDGETAEMKLCRFAYVSFANSSQIISGIGEMKPVEKLRASDQLLTLDPGLKKICWNGYGKMHATGAQAPVLLKAVVLQNENDLVLSCDQRLYVYQQDCSLGAARADSELREQHLFDGKNIISRDMGYIAYLQLLLDQHQIIYL